MVMRDILRRLAWQNLPLQAKTAALFLLQVGLITAVALVALAGQTTVRQELQTSVATSVEMRALAQNLQLDIETLQRLESRLVEQQFGWTSFGLVRDSLLRDHQALTDRLSGGAARLEEQGFLVMGAQEIVPLSIEVRTIQTNASTLASNFDQMVALVDQLTAAEGGLLPAVERHGERLEQLTIEQGDSELIRQMLLMRSREQTLVDTGAPADLRALEDAAAAYTQIYQTNIPIARRSDDIPREMENYLQAAREVARLQTQLQTSYRASQLSVGFIRDAASRLGVLTETQRQAQLTRLESIQNQARNTLFAGLALTLLVGSLLTYLFARYLAVRSERLLRAARDLEQGNLGARALVEGADEFSRLGGAFNAMAEQLQDLVGGLERRVAERTRDLTITAEIGRAVTTQRDARTLMNEIVELIRQRFGYYHAQVFLLDESGENANLVASTGAAGRELLARRHALAVGSQSVIGQVTARGEPLVALDTDADAIHRRNELLPDTRSEMALPMRVGERVIGALDVQSVAPNAFDEDVVAVFQIMADQLAAALENARLQAELADLQGSLEALERRMTAEAWDAYRQARTARAPLGYELRGEQIEPHASGVPEPMSEAIAAGRLICQENGDGEVSLAVPIRVRGEVIGAFGFAGDRLHRLTDEDLSLIEAVVDRVGLTLENLRLVEETARRVEHEQLLNEITAKIVGSTDVNHILQTTVRELGRVLRAPQTSVQLRREETDR